MGGDAPDPGKRWSRPDPDHCPHGARHGRRSREGDGSRVQRLRYEAGGDRPAPREDGCPPWRSTVTQPPGSLSAAQVSALRHELRTPVNHIVGYCELMLEDSTGEP